MYPISLMSYEIDDYESCHVIRKITPNLSEAREFISKNTTDHYDNNKYVEYICYCDEKENLYHPPKPIILPARENFKTYY